MKAQFDRFVEVLIPLRRVISGADREGALAPQFYGFPIRSRCLGGGIDIPG